MEKKRIYYSYPEFERTFFPKDVLERMERELCRRLDLIFSYQHSLVTNNEDKRCGTVEVAKPHFSLEDTASIGLWLKDFYKQEGYEIEDESCGRVVAKKDKESFIASVVETETSFLIFVSKDRVALSRQS